MPADAPIRKASVGEPVQLLVQPPAVELLGPDIIIAHAKDLDHDGEAGHLAAGKGLLDYAYYLGLLKQAGFKGPLLLHGLAESVFAEPPPSRHC